MEVKHGMCGNGIRCLAKYLYEQKLTDEKSFIIETLSGNKYIELIIENKTVIGVKVDMGEVSTFGKLDIEIENEIFKRI